MYHVIIIGGGPAGLQAAVYIGRAGKKVLIIDKGEDEKILAADIQNLFGFEDGILGRILMVKGIKQAQKFGAEIKTEEVTNIKKESKKFIVTSTSGNYESEYLILSTGKSLKPSGIKNEIQFIGKGISYCVACDGYFYKEKKIGIIGHGNFAASEALELTNYTKQIIIFTNGKEVNMNPELMKEIEQNNIQINKEKIVELEGKDFVEKLILENSEEPVEGIFVAMGSATSIDFARSLGVEIEGNFIKVDEKMKTNVDKAYAAGDCRGPPFQLSKALGEAAIAALEVIGKKVQY